jgi:dTDP-4-amino-4,6-dideoxygalactose transaminase
MDFFRSGAYRKRLFGEQATQTHEFLEQDFPNTLRGAWETVWLPQFALLGDEEDMNEIASAIGKIQRNAAEIAANASQAVEERIAR